MDNICNDLISMTKIKLICVRTFFHILRLLFLKLIIKHVDKLCNDFVSMTSINSMCVRSYHLSHLIIYIYKVIKQVDN